VNSLNFRQAKTSDSALSAKPTTRLKQDNEHHNRHTQIR
jgi:hypothetical protein